MQETAKREQESSKCRKLDGYLSFSTSMTSVAPEVEPSEDSLSTFSPEEGDSTQAVVVKSEVGSSKDLLVSTFSLEAGDSIPAASAAQVVEVEPSEDLAIPGPLNYLVEVDPLEDLSTSTNYRLEDENGTVRLCAIIDTCKEYPTDPHLFCDTPVTPDQVRALLELGHCQPGLKDSFPKDEDRRHFSPTWYKKKKRKMVVKLIGTGWFTYQEKIQCFVFLVGFLEIGRIIGVIQKLVARFLLKAHPKWKNMKKSESHKQAEK